MQSWLTAYQSNLNNIASDQQQFASVNWWGNMQVAGSMETYPQGNDFMTQTARWCISPPAPYLRR